MRHIYLLETDTIAMRCRTSSPEGQTDTCVHTLQLICRPSDLLVVATRRAAVSAISIADYRTRAGADDAISIGVRIFAASRCPLIEYTGRAASKLGSR
jgi:hypothetical protein